MQSKTNQGSSNRLILEKSPYLLQHANNPVDWHAWGEEAFEKARVDNKPIFLSIGYSTCHWCHVMAHESFEDTGVARLMNDAFVSIKVDREERPDIDDVYMTICHMLTGSGGWPLSIVMTPDKKPFFAATYIPKETRFGRIGMLELIPRIKDVWENRIDEVLASANQITTSLQGMASTAPGQDLNSSLLDQTYELLASRFDEKYGGFGSAPKFPTPHNLLFLLRYWKRTQKSQALEMVERTLQQMKLGGIYDHVGFGFHRYSTDQEWLVPHFEKMLYDQAMLAIAYTEAYQATGKDEYAATTREIFSYILRDMTSPEGGFYSAEDADSEGEEGKFYVWSEFEIRQILEEKEANLLVGAFKVQKNGNYLEEATQQKTGDNILHRETDFSELAHGLGITEKDFRSRLESARQNLFHHREKRVHPHKDDKILTDWNGLMIAALAKASRALDEPDYAKAAQRAADFMMTTMRTPEGRLLHRYRDGEAALTAFAEDYAFAIWGMLELYEATFEAKHLQTALDLNRDLLQHFWDTENGGLYSTPDDGEELLVRRKEVYDGAIPSANSVTMLNLLRLSQITADPELEKMAAEIGRAFSSDVNNAPVAYTQLMCALDFAIGPSYEVVIAGDLRAQDTQAMIKAATATFIPNKVLILNPTDQESPPIHTLAEFIKDQSSIDGMATAYVCLNYNCQMPTTEPGRMLELLNSQN